jgi:hypothetical protein
MVFRAICLLSTPQNSPRRPNLPPQRLNPPVAVTRGVAAGEPVLVPQPLERFLPILGHATWHLYRRTVVLEPVMERIAWSLARGHLGEHRRVIDDRGLARGAGNFADL